MDAQALGRYLRQSREAKELTLEDAEQALRIRRRILESFELGEFQIADLSPVQLNGFIRNYARFLGLDENLIVQYYESSLFESADRQRRRARRATKRNKRDSQNGSGVPIAQARITDTQPKMPPPLIVTRTSSLGGVYDSPRRGIGLLGWLLRVLIAGASLAVIVFVVSQLLTNPTVFLPDTDLQQRDILAELPPTSTITPFPTRTPIPATPIPEGLQQLYTGQGLLVTIQFRQRSWVRLVADSTERFVGVAAPGMILEYPAQQEIFLTASNAEALEIVFNGEFQPTFGDRGQRVDLTFTSAGVDIVTGPGFEPTAEMSDTPLPSPTDPAGALIAALTPTDTPGPSPTPSDTPTITLTPSDTPPATDTPTITNTPTITLTPSATLTVTRTPTNTSVPTNTSAPTNTPIPSATAILPPRVTATGQPPPKGR